LLVGSYHGAVDYDYPLWVIKTDSMGMVQWDESFNVPGWPSGNHGRNFEILGDSGYVIACSKLGSVSGFSLVRIDTLGNEIWRKQYSVPPFSMWNDFWASALTHDSCILVVVDYCYDNSGNPPLATPMLFKINAYTGVQQWVKKYQFPFDVRIHGVYVLPDSGILMYGYEWNLDTINIVESKYVGFILRLDANGDSLWYRKKEYRPGVRDYHKFYGLTLTPDKGFAGVGEFLDYYTGLQYTWLVKMDSLGCAVPNCLDTILGIVVMEQFKDVFLVVYPNPVSEQLTIGINEYHESIRELAIYDLNGRCIVRKEIHSPSHVMDVSHYKAGLYILRILTENGKWVEQKFVKE
jgi:hypothetical protein